MTRNIGMAVVVVALAWGLGIVSCEAAELGRSVPPTVKGAAGGLGDNPATGLQIALFTPAQIFPETYDVSGLRLDLIYGRNSNLRGFDLGIVNHITGVVEGFQFGAVNLADDLSGLQIGAYNSANDSSMGCCQIGAVNIAKDISGVQIGIFNMCNTISGVQIGFLNFINQSDVVVFCPIFNAQF